METDIAGPDVDQPVVAEVPWPAPDSCPALVRALTAMHEDGRIPRRSEDAPLAIVVEPTQEASIRRDLPIPVATSADTVASRCILEIGGPIDGIALDRRALRKARLHSSYPSGTRTVRNPEYERLERRARSMKEDDDGGLGIFATGDPMLDLVGLVAGGIISGISALTDGQGGDSVEQTLDETPSMIDMPILSPYSYDLAEIEAARRTRLAVSLVDRETDQRWSSEIRLWEKKRFALSDDRHPGDPTRQHDPQATLITSSQLDNWERSLPPLTVSRALRSAVNASPSMDFAGIFGGEDAGIPIETSEKFISVPTDIVRVGDTGQGRGFYVDPEHILTLSRYTRGSSLTRVTLTDGGWVYGLVEKEDPASDLALVYMPRAGNELRLATYETLLQVEDLPLGLTPGTPISDGAGVVALVTAIDEQGLAETMSAAEIGRFLENVKR